jgi:hypothetical protein
MHCTHKDRGEKLSDDGTRRLEVCCTCGVTLREIDPRVREPLCPGCGAMLTGAHDARCPTRNDS